MLAIIGEVVTFPNPDTDADDTLLVEWRIPNIERHCRSDSFKFAGEIWHFCMRPRGVFGRNSDFVDLFLVKEESPTECHVLCETGLKYADGTVWSGRALGPAFRAGEDSWGWFFLTKSELQHYFTKLDVLTIACSMRRVEPGRVRTGILKGIDEWYDTHRQME